MEIQFPLNEIFIFIFKCSTLPWFRFSSVSLDVAIKLTLFNNKKIVTNELKEK